MDTPTGRTAPNEFTLLREKAGLTVEEAADRTGYDKATVYRWERGETKPRKAALELVRTLSQGPLTRTSAAPFSFIDLFAGIGGMRLGFESAGGTCVYTSEWNESSRKTYQANFGGLQSHYVHGDITKIAAEEIPEHDVLVAGFPCQPFSIAGVSKKNALGRPHGFLCETQGTLFFDIARILHHHKPAAFLLENVKNLRSHDRGRTFRTITETLCDELGYTIDFRVIDAKGWVPQHRERIFIVGFRVDTGFSFDDVSIPPAESGPRLKRILHSEDGTETTEPPYTEEPEARVSPKYTLSRNLWKYLRDYADKHKAKGNGFGFGLVGPEDVARTLSARYFKDGSEILVRQGSRKPPRRLTPRECARLMGFDAPGRAPFQIPVSDTQAYRQFGNAVVVPVVATVAQAMAPHILAVRNGTAVPPPSEWLFPEMRRGSSRTAVG